MAWLRIHETAASRLYLQTEEPASIAVDMSTGDPREPPHWQWDASQNAYLWWNGDRFTTRARPIGDAWAYEPFDQARPVTRAGQPRARATMRRTLVMIGLIAAQIVVLVWGGHVFSQAEEKDCEVSEFTYTDPADLPWAPWVVLAGLAAAGFLLRADVRWMKVTSILGLVVAGLTFPGLIVFAGAANCGL